MTDLFLIAHKVRGEPAFDVACHMDCPNCHGGHDLFDDAYECTECDSTGFWWIVPTSGHRAYPYWYHDLFDLYSNPEQGTLNCREMIGNDEVPDNWPDHYQARSAPTAPAGLAALLAKRKPLNVERRGR
jgi:hypothetical protein